MKRVFAVYLKDEEGNYTNGERTVDRYAAMMNTIEAKQHLDKNPRYSFEAGSFEVSDDLAVEYVKRGYNVCELHLQGKASGG